MAAAFGAKIIPFGAVGEDDLAQVIKLKYLLLFLICHHWLVCIVFILYGYVLMDV